MGQAQWGHALGVRKHRLDEELKPHVCADREKSIPPHDDNK